MKAFITRILPVLERQANRWTITAKIYRWFEDGLFRQLFKNASVLLFGNLLTAAIDLIALSVTARALGPELFGILTLIVTYVRIVDTLVNFQSWQAIIKYGADALVQKRSQDFKSLIKFGTLLDLFSAVLGMGIAIAGLNWVGSLQGWTPETIQLARGFSIMILFNLMPTPMAILRLFDRFNWLAFEQAGVAFARLVMLGVAYFAGAGLQTFLWIWLVMYIVNYLVLLGLGWYELRRQGIRGVLAAPVRNISRLYPGIWKFVWTTNASSSIRMGAQEVDVMIVGALLGPAPVGIYKIAKQFGSIPTRFADPMQQAIYPDMAKLWAQGAADKFRKFILRMGALSGALGIGIWLFFLVAGRFVLWLTVGEEYLSAYGLLLVYMLGYILFMFGVSFRPAVLSMNHPERILAIYVGAHMLYFALLVLLLLEVGVMGASIAQVAFHLAWFIAMVLSIVQFSQASRPGQPEGEGELVL